MFYFRTESVLTDGYTVQQKFFSQDIDCDFRCLHLLSWSSSNRRLSLNRQYCSLETGKCILNLNQTIKQRNSLHIYKISSDTLLFIVIISILTTSERTDQTAISAVSLSKYQWEQFSFPLQLTVNNFDKTFISILYVFLMYTRGSIGS